LRKIAKLFETEWKTFWDCYEDFQGIILKYTLLGAVHKGHLSKKGSKSLYGKREPEKKRLEGGVEHLHTNAARHPL
jgi:hypothetical protein